MNPVDGYRKELNSRPPSAERSVNIETVAKIIAGSVIALSLFVMAVYVLDRPGNFDKTVETVVSPDGRLFPWFFDNISSGGARLGRAGVAPLMRQCMAKIEAVQDFMDDNTEIDPGLVSIINRFGKRTRESNEDMAPYVHCLLERDPAALCDRDNRALVVESVNRFLRIDDGLMRELAEKNRARDGVERHVREGRLARRDFGWFAPDSVKKLFEQIAPSPDRCAA
jgi:hypothetical protein